MEAPTGGIEVGVVQRFVDVAVDALAEAREEIDALNVYPVPDGDTGTNMYLTMSAARDAIQEAVAEHADLATA
ncbi:MAG: Dak phosphatase, partial [Nocardioides sp.]